MAKPRERREKCPKCGGSGELVHAGQMTNMDVERAVGIKNQTVSKFLKGGGLTLVRGLQLMAWLDKEALEDGDVEETPTSPAARGLASDRMRQLREASAAGRTALASGAIDAMNRPLNAGGGASLMLRSAGLVS